MVFERLDFIYTPSRDVAADVEHFTTVLGAELVFAIEAFDSRVAMVRVAADSPGLLFADHLEGERPILVFRVADIDAALADIAERGFEPGPRVEIPHGPCCSIDAPGGHRLAVYELTRPEVPERFAGRRDF